LACRDRTELDSASVPAARGHFSHAVAAGDTVYISGLLAIDGSGKISYPDDVERQTEAIFDALEAILAEAGCQLGDVLKLTTYVTDIADRSVVNDVRRRRFGSVRPASTLVGVNALAAEGACIEIDAIAHARSDEGRSRSGDARGVER
jgi:2-iminobutanoate/2-iminopropanoate deaminase